MSCVAIYKRKERISNSDRLKEDECRKHTKHDSKKVGLAWTNEFHSDNLYKLKLFENTLKTTKGVSNASREDERNFSRFFNALSISIRKSRG